MRHIVIASHAHFADGIAESITLLVGIPCDIRTISCFVDGTTDVAAAVRATLADIPEADEVVVCTDLLGGSVNNELLSIVQEIPNIYLVTNMNLPLLLTLALGINDEEDLPAFLRSLVNSDKMRPVFCNDALADVDEDEEF